MRKSILIILAALGSAGAYAQSLERQAIGAAGDFTTASWGSLSSTTGESVVRTTTASSIVLTQGFQQPSLSKVAVYNVRSENIDVSVFPVPASDKLTVAINTRGDYHITLLNLQGQQLKLPFRDAGSSIETRLIFDVRSLANGLYMVLISDGHHTNVKTVKFTKIN